MAAVLAPALDVGCGDGWFSLLNGMIHPEVRFTGIALYEAEEAREIPSLRRGDEVVVPFRHFGDHMVPPALHRQMIL
jgi:hypothetical protein